MNRVGNKVTATQSVSRNKAERASVAEMIQGRVSMMTTAAVKGGGKGGEKKTKERAKKDPPACLTLQGDSASIAVEPRKLP